MKSNHSFFRYRTFCANLAGRSYQMTKVCWKCYQGYQVCLQYENIYQLVAMIWSQKYNYFCMF